MTTIAEQNRIELGKQISRAVTLALTTHVPASEFLRMAKDIYIRHGTIAAEGCHEPEFELFEALIDVEADVA